MRFDLRDYPLHHAPTLRCRRGTVEETEHNFNVLDSKKAEKTYTDSELAKKADKTYADSELAKKADKTYADSELAKKADKTVVEDLLNMIMPVGSIVAWHKNLPGMPALSGRWAECNGQTLSDGQSPLNGQTLPNLNGEARFLRGSNTSGTFQDDSFETHGHSFTVQPHSHGFDLAGHSHGINGKILGVGPHQHNDSSWQRIDAAFGDGQFPVGGNRINIDTGGGSTGNRTYDGGGQTSPTTSAGGSETRPVNMSVVYIMRIK